MTTNEKKKAKRTELVFGAFVLLFGLVVLVGWLFGDEIFAWVVDLLAGWLGWPAWAVAVGLTLLGLVSYVVISALPDSKKTNPPPPPPTNTPQALARGPWQRRWSGGEQSEEPTPSATPE